MSPECEPGIKKNNGNMISDGEKSIGKRGGRKKEDSGNGSRLTLNG